MDLIETKPVIISVGVGGWYPKGVERLERSLNFVGWPGHVLTWKNMYPPTSHKHEEVPYYFKIAAFEWALYQQYTHVLFVDASFWAVKNPVPMFDIINDQGYYMFSSGYSLAQSVNDNALGHVGVSRDEAESVTEWATGCVGFNFNNPKAREVYKLWKHYMDIGLSKGSRLHDNQSVDPRFLFHRQDQSCFSLACYKLGIRNTQGLDMIAYKSTNYNPEEIIWFIEGC